MASHGVLSLIRSLVSALGKQGSGHSASDFTVSVVLYATSMLVFALYIKLCQRLDDRRRDAQRLNASIISNDIN
jgi:hypothetical protein